jgi:hypothetical protein
VFVFFFVVTWFKFSNTASTLINSARNDNSVSNAFNYEIKKKGTASVQNNCSDVCMRYI